VRYLPAELDSAAQLIPSYQYQETFPESKSPGALQPATTENTTRQTGRWIDRRCLALVIAVIAFLIIVAVALGTGLGVSLSRKGVAGKTWLISQFV
jgi:hypothetical protein